MCRPRLHFAAKAVKFLPGIRTYVASCEKNTALIAAGSDTRSKDANKRTSCVAD